MTAIAIGIEREKQMEVMEMVRRPVVVRASAAPVRLLGGRRGRPRWVRSEKKREEGSQCPLIRFH